MPVGQTFPSESRSYRDRQTGRQIRQLTAGAGNEYPVYYQAYPLSLDGRWLVVCSERDGTTQLYGLDRRDGTITQLTDADAPNTGWWP